MRSPVLPASEEFSTDIKDSHMKNNAELQLDVQNAIKWEPLLHAAEIGVTAKDGVITLTGTVDSYAKKWEAEKAAMNVAGVNAVAEEITVKFGSWGKKDDTEIATSAANALKWNWQVPNDKVKVQVQNGWVTLTGELQWNYEREAAHNAIRPLLGVVGVTNTITIKADAHNKVEKELVEDAIARHWSISDQDIKVNVLDNTVTLTGTVGSMYQKQKAGRVAWNTPGIYNVNNDLLVEYDYAAVAL
ncbi:MAG: BON domain-containing protein [Flavobacteriales bacterium]